MDFSHFPEYGHIPSNRNILKNPNFRTDKVQMRGKVEPLSGNKFELQTNFGSCNELVYPSLSVCMFV